MAIVRRRGTIQSEKFVRRRRKKIIFTVALFVVAIGSVVATVYLFFSASFVQIKSVEVSGPVGVNGGVLSLVSADAVHADIEQALAGNWGFLVSKNTLWFYPKNAIRAELSETYPAIASVTFYSSGGFLGFGTHTVLHVLITERSPFAVTCSADSGQSCFYLDDSGFVYAPAPTFSPGTYVRYGFLPSADASSTHLATGKALVDADTFALAKTIVGTLSGMRFDVLSDDIGFDPFGSEHQITIQNAAPVDASTTVVYFNQNEPLATELRYFSEFLKSQATSTDTRFQYIDMRYGKDIVYKLYQ